ncbi:MAG: T9SS C-terminal target domain-containing protein [Bacteroidetes bacterium]|nr:MAG: T9SS C-terminal target domain-containing protein [Bacteroidota bacterium]
MKKTILISLAILLQFICSNAQTGSALKFDGGNDHVIINANSYLNLTQFTIETWVYWERSGVAVDFIIGKGIEQLEIHTGGPSSNNIRFIPTTGVYIDGGINTITSNTWVHLACVYDPSIGLAKMYINGVEVTTSKSGANPLTTPVNANANNLSIGLRSDGSFPFLGALDEFRLWNRALTQEEIQNKMNCEIANNAAGLVLNYHFNQGTASGSNLSINTLLDHSGYVNNGTLAGFDLTGSSSNWITPGGIANGNSCAIAGNNVGCTSATLTVSGGVSYLWSGGLALTSAVNSFTASGLYTVTITAANSTTSIASEYVALAITTPSAPIVPSIQSFCGIIKLSQLSVSGQNIMWFSSSVGGLSLSSNTTFIGQNTFYASQNPFGCESGRTIVSVLSNPIPSVPTVSGIQNICSGFKVESLTAVGQNIQWFYSQDINNPIAANTSIYSNEYYVNQKVNGCFSDFVTVEINVPEEPSLEIEYSPSSTINAGESILFDADYNTKNPDYINPRFQWFINSSLVGSNSNKFSTSSLKNQDRVTITLTVTSSFCPLDFSTSDAVTINVRQYPANNYFYNGKFGDDFGTLIDVSVAQDGKIFATSANSMGVEVWTQSGNNFGKLTTFGSFGQNPGEIDNPYSIQAANNGYIYIADRDVHHISVWTQSGNTFGFFANFGSFGTGLDQFDRPIDVAISPNGNIIVCDSRNYRFSVWTQSGNTFGAIATFSGPNTDASNSITPFAVEVDAQNNIYVSDGGPIISVWTQSGTNFVMVNTFSGLGLNDKMEDYEIGNQFGLEIANDGKIFVTDLYTYQINVFTQSGNNFGVFASFGSSGDADFEFSRLRGISVSQDNKVFIADDNDNSIKIWEPCSIPSTIITQPQSQYICDGEQVVLNVSVAGITPVHYYWNTESQSLPTLTVSGFDNYNVKVIGCGTFYSNYAQIKEHEIITNRNYNTSFSTCLGSNVTLGIEASGTSVLFYKWSNNATTTSINTNVPGSYIVTITGTCDDVFISNPLVLTSITDTNIVCSTTGISTYLPIYQSNSFSIYPNPTSGAFTIEGFDKLSLTTSVEIYNAIGGLVYTQKLVSETTVINANLAKGIYLVKVGNETKKLVVE